MCEAYEEGAVRTKYGGDCLAGDHRVSAGIWGMVLGRGGRRHGDRVGMDDCDSKVGGAGRLLEVVQMVYLVYWRTRLRRATWGVRHAALRQRAGKEINPSACFEVSRRYNPDRSYFYYMTERTGPIEAFHSFM